MYYLQKVVPGLPRKGNIMELLDIVCAVADRTRYTRREIRGILRAAASIIKEELGQGRSVSWRGLGQFENAYRGHRIGRDPRTKGETTMYVPPGRRLKFIPSAELLNAVRSSARFFEEANPEQRYLPTKEAETNGKVRRRNRPEEGGGEGEDSWKDLLLD